MSSTRHKSRKEDGSPGKFPPEVQKQRAIAAARGRLKELVETNRIPGIAAGILQNGHVLLQEGFGYASLEHGIAVNPRSTLFRTASISKPIAATALLHMVSEGIIELDTSFYQYVPNFPKKKYDFTIRQLAGHTAGIRGYRGKEYGLNKPFGIRESLSIFKDDPLLFEPGTSFHYNSFGWVLISLAMEEASGIPFSEYVEMKVMQPLGLRHTIPENNAISLENKATFYTKTENDFRIASPVNNGYKLAAGGYLSTVTDIAALGQAYVERLIGDPALVEEFLTTGTAGGTPTYYGLGWEVSEDAGGRPYFGHSGNSVGACTRFQVYHESSMIFTFLVNCTNPGITTELERITENMLTTFEADGT